MKKKILIFLSIILSILVLASIFYFVDKNSNRLVLKCTYTTNVIDIGRLNTYELGISDKLLFIDIKNATINNRDWQPRKNITVDIDKDYIDFEEGKTLTHIDRVLGEYLETEEKEGRLYTSTGKCEEFNYKKRF